MKTRWGNATMGLLALGLLALGGSSAEPPSPETLEWTIEGEKRQALVFFPTQGKGIAPVILVFHGHGGTMKSMAQKGFQRHWPEAVVVCPQGLPTKTARDPEGKRAGWQPRQGDNKDRDLLFFDAILKTLHEKHKIDPKRIYATGHSNGGGFTYLLWATRGAELAAVAPSAAGAGALRGARSRFPIPVLHVAGEKDDVVPFENQKRTMETVRKGLGCEDEGKPWAKAGNLVGTLYPSKDGTPFVSVIHPGTHQYPAEAPELIVQFFKEHTRK